MGNEYLKAGENSFKAKSSTTRANPGKVQLQQHPILQLQQAIGNQTLARMIRSQAIQAKLTVGQAGDSYEQEADHVADQVMRMPDPDIQRQPEEEEEKLQTAPLSGTITPLIQRQSPEEEEKIQGKMLGTGQTMVQKQGPLEEEEEKLQTKSASDTASTIDASLEGNINNLRGGGQPLPESVRNYFEPRFGYDFSQVRVHTDSGAAETAQAVNAKAYTLGQDVVFGAGQYAPDHEEGKKLIAHELTHVVQQNGK